MELVRARRVEIRPTPSLRAFFSTGFRPFFLLGAAFGAVLVPLWISLFLGAWAADWRSPYNMTVWHGHELLFGFVFAIIAGFLLTAVQNWTDQRTTTPTSLAMLVGTWVLGRIVMFFSGLLPFWIVAAVDLSFLPLVTWFVWQPIHITRNQRNVVLVVLLTCGALVHLALHVFTGMDDVPRAQTALYGALDLVLLVIALIGGRVIPFFTRNVTRIEPRPWGVLDKIAIGSVACLFAAHSARLFVDASSRGHTAIGLIAVIAGVSNVARLWGWGGTRTFRTPILWVLHVGYAWLGCGLVLYGWAILQRPAAATAALHALTVGCIGMLCLGMMSRVALGHTGRALQPKGVVEIAYGLLLIAAVVRSPFAIIWPNFLWLALIVSTVLWTLAFTIFFVNYAPILVCPRADGKPG